MCDGNEMPCDLEPPASSVSVPIMFTFFLIEHLLHLFCFIESGSYVIAQAGLELCLSLPSTGVISMHCHAWPLLCLLLWLSYYVGCTPLHPWVNFLSSVPLDGFR